MILLGIGSGVPLGLLSVLIYLKGGHIVFELSDHHTKDHCRKSRMEMLGETWEQVEVSFEKHHRGLSLNEYRPLRDKLIVLIITVILAFVCYEFGYNQANLWILELLDSWGGVGLYSVLVLLEMVGKVSKVSQ